MPSTSVRYVHELLNHCSGASSQTGYFGHRCSYIGSGCVCVCGWEGVRESRFDSWANAPV